MKLRIIMEDNKIGYGEYLKYAPKIDIPLELLLYFDEVFPKITEIIHEEIKATRREEAEDPWPKLR